MKFFFFLLFLSGSYASIAQNLVKINECIIDQGVLKEIQLDYNSQNGDKSIVVNGVRKNFTDVYPTTGKDYAAGEAWYINNDQIPFNGKSYVKYGLPRVLGVREIEKKGTYGNIGVYVEAGSTGLIEVIYIPVRHGCEFQPYKLYCGDLEIEQVNSNATTIVLTAKATGFQGKISYDWTSENAVITKGKNTKTVTIDTKNKKDGDKITITATASDARDCPVRGYEFITIKKPKATPKTKTTNKKA